MPSTSTKSCANEKGRSQYYSTHKKITTLQKTNLLVKEKHKPF